MEVLRCGVYMRGSIPCGEAGLSRQCVNVMLLAGIEVTPHIRLLHIRSWRYARRELPLARANVAHGDQQMSYKMSYTLVMADTITFRPDEDTSKALEVLTKDGTPVSAVVRTALIDAARRKASAAIRAEAERLAEDESDRAEAMQVLRDMETLRAW
jgi:hypothetical protein